MIITRWHLFQSSLTTCLLCLVYIFYTFYLIRKKKICLCRKNDLGISLFLATLRLLYGFIVFCDKYTCEQSISFSYGTISIFPNIRYYYWRIYLYHLFSMESYVRVQD